MHGYAGKLLRIDLGSRTIKTEKLDLETAQKFIGGRGLATKFLVDEIDPGVDALSPANKLLFVTGPLTGTNTPTGGRYMVVTKSPLSGTVACSNSGGFWGAELKFAGYDLLIFEGKASSPVYLSIADDQVALHDAGHLWGKVVSETTHALEQVHGEKAKVATIGPAGENLSRIACIMNDLGRAAGRSGVGAVMGSKNLKAIVVRGTGKVGVAKPDQLREAAASCMKKIRENGVTGQGLPTYGTAVLVNIINENGVYPTKNFQFGTFDRADETSGETLAEKYLKKKDPCFRCPIACGRYCEVDDVKGAGPEYETVWAYGADCGVSELPDIIKANYWCNEMGLDTISAGATIAAAMELYQRGYLKQADLEGGPELTWGNGQAIIEWTKRMGAPAGLGAKMAQGSYRLCELYGVPELAMTVKKLELPAYDPRGIQGHGVQYATSNRGGCHVRGYMISPEILGVPEKLDRFSLEGKPAWVKTFQDFTAAIDSSGLCLFTSFAMGADDYAALVNAVAGTDFTGSSFIQAGERIWNLERVFNLRAGVEADTLPRRLLEQPLPDGPSKGWVHQLDALLPVYYQTRGWNARGVPSQEKLAELGL
jgi:aldehyde:ferredoxin oxidoreductase